MLSDRSAHTTDPSRHSREQVGVYDVVLSEYRKIPKISPGAYIFQRPFLRDLFFEGLIFGGAYLRKDICVSKSIGLALYLAGNLPFSLCFALYLRATSKYKPSRGGGGACIRRGDLTEGFLRYEFGGLIFGGAYAWRGLFSEFYGILTNPTIPQI